MLASEVMDLCRECFEFGDPEILGDSVIFDDGRLIFENSIGTTFVIY